MLGKTPHLPLNRDGERLLVHFADPVRRAPPNIPLPEPEQIKLLVAAADNHGVMPSLVRGLSDLIEREAKRTGESETTALKAARSELETARLQVAYQTGFQIKTLYHTRRVMAAFSASGIIGALVKGAAFAQRLYAEPSLRTFTDADILIPVEHRFEAAEIMRSLGFILSEFEDRKGKDYHEQKWLLPPRHDVMIEVHSNLVHSPKLRGSMSIGYEDVCAAGDGDCTDATALLFVAATHGAIGHQLDRLQHLVDVMQAARGVAGSIDEDRLARICERCGVTLAVAGALELAGKTFGEPRCINLARKLMPSPFSRLPGQLLSPGLVVRGQSQARGRGSWRRKLFRQALKIA